MLEHWSYVFLALTHRLDQIIIWQQTGDRSFHETMMAQVTDTTMCPHALWIYIITVLCPQWEFVRWKKNAKPSQSIDQVISSIVDDFFLLIYHQMTMHICLTFGDRWVRKVPSHLKKWILLIFLFSRSSTWGKELERNVFVVTIQLWCRCAVFTLNNPYEESGTRNKTLKMFD